MIDAHNHLQDDRLDLVRDEILRELPELGLRRAVVDGSGVEDWGAVAGLARRVSWVQPSFGVHPWYVKEQPDGWLETLRRYLSEFPHAGVGEIGLDRWVEGADVALQMRFFQEQLRLACAEDRALSIHCLRAWGLMEETLRSARLPSRGFLLHSYGGPAEMVAGFARHGGYFSISPYFFHPRKAAQLETFRSIVPLDRLLIETDAPDMRPPDGLNPHPLAGTAGDAINDPRNITWIYERVADLRGMALDELREVVGKNFQCWWSGSGR